MEYAVKIDHLVKNFGSFALRDVSLAIPGGTILGLIGENGAGKSTVIKCLLGVLHPDGGDIALLEGEGLTGVGYVPDECPFSDQLKVKQVGAFCAGLFPGWEDSLFAHYLEKFDLPADKKVKELSRGMKMKLSITVALSHRPKLLVLDEATSGLDPIVRDEVLEIFNEFTREEDHSILISSHILSDLEKLCDYIAFLHRGRLLFCDEKDRLLEAYGVFAGTAEQMESLREEAVIGREASGYGGVRALVRREEVPAGLELERATVEDIILFMVKGAKK